MIHAPSSLEFAVAGGDVPSDDLLELLADFLLQLVSDDAEERDE